MRVSQPRDTKSGRLSGGPILQRASAHLHLTAYSETVASFNLSKWGEVWRYLHLYADEIIMGRTIEDATVNLCLWVEEKAQGQVCDFLVRLGKR